MIGSDPSSPNLQSVFALADQVERALLTGCEPEIWTPQFAAACRLMAITMETHRVIRPMLEVLARSLEQAPGAEVSRILTQTSTAECEDLKFLGEPLRIQPAGGPPGTIYRLDVIHAAFAALALPSEEATRRITRYAINRDAFLVAFREFRRRLEKIGPRDAALGAVGALVMGILPDMHERALTTLQRLGRLHRLERALPPDLRGFACFEENNREGGVDRTNTRREETLAEFNVMLSALLTPLKEKGEHELVGMMLDRDPELAHLPHAAEMDLRNKFTEERKWSCRFCGARLSGKPICPKCQRSISEKDRVSRAIELTRKDDGGECVEEAESDIAERFAEELEIQGALPSEVRPSPKAFTPPIMEDAEVRRWLARPPKGLRLTQTDREILKEIQKALQGQTPPLGSDRDLATRARCHPSMITAFYRKITKYHQKAEKRCLK